VQSQAESTEAIVQAGNARTESSKPSRRGLAILIEPEKGVNHEAGDVLNLSEVSCMGTKISIWEINKCAKK